MPSKPPPAPPSPSLFFLYPLHPSFLFCLAPWFLILLFRPFPSCSPEGRLLYLQVVRLQSHSPHRPPLDPCTDAHPAVRELRIFSFLFLLLHPSSTMRRPPNPLFLLLLLFLLPCLEAAKKKGKPKGDGESLPSGELSTKEGHRCTWEVQEGRNNNIQLQLSCIIPGEKEEGEWSKPSYTCQLSGKPQECPAFVAKPAQYWKQVVGKLKKRSNACEGEKVLKTRLCKKAPAAAHMKMVERKGDGQNEGGKKKGAGNKEGEKEKQPREETREEEPMLGDSDSYGMAADADVAESYCGEGWNSVCRFFSKLLDG
uniref:Fibroblast growth factor binding protein 3 n=1 Tax=Astyanax mexicanus TaxID=7994 RepID=A0A3B1IIL0_ASTMX